MKKSLLKSEAGVIHHLGLIIFAVALVGVIGFAVYRIQGGNEDVNYGYDESSVTLEDEAESEIDSNDQEADNSVTEPEQDTLNAEEEN